MENVIELETITKKFNDVEALKNFSYQMKDFSTLGLIGPNGAGKTTLIKIITGLIKSYQGEGSIFGYDLRKDNLQIRKRTGIAFEFEQVPSHISVKSLLKFIASIRKVQDINSTISRFQLQDHLEKKIKDLSAGLKKRAILAQSFIGYKNLSFFILDEPTSNLDIESRFIFYDLVNELKAENKMFLISSHNFQDIERFADNIVLLMEGEKITEFDPNNLESLPNVTRVSIKNNSIYPFYKKLKQQENIPKIKILSPKEMIFTANSQSTKDLLQQFDTINFDIDTKISLESILWGYMNE
ncbi:MAG: ABC transporter ATP-binding protein [Promethearchaeota archaeon]